MDKKKKNKDGKIIEFDDVITFDNILNAEYHIEKGKKGQSNTNIFHANLYPEIAKLLKQLQENTYKIKKLYSFVIYEPKKRNITANQFDDKIIQRASCKEILEPAIGPKLIYDNYASQPGKGTLLAIERLQHFMKSFAATQCDWGNEGYIFSGDIHHYFYEIDREICMKQVGELPIDKKCEELIYKQINAIGDFDHSDKGVCIGFQTSQWLAVNYLNGMDHFIKEKLHIKYYGRYMDNFYIIHKDKEYIQYCVKEIQKYLTKNLNLELNKKSNIHPFSQGLVFLGFHFTYNPRTHDVDIALLKKNINRMLTKTNKILNLVDKGLLEVGKAYDSHQSWYAYGQISNQPNAENAHNKAKNKIDKVANKYLDYAYPKETRDYNGFITLIPKQPRDSERFIKLVPKGTIGANPFPYIQKKSKRCKATKSINQALSNLSSA